MSGLGETGGFYSENANAGPLVSPKDQDEWTYLNIDNPSVDTKWFGSFSGGTAGTNNPITRLNALSEWPRNAFYTILGVASGTFGGTFTANWIDQFGSVIQEKVVVASAAPAVGVYGTAIIHKFLSGTFASQGSSGGSTGTAQIGYGTLANGSAQSNWFGLMTRIAGTNDVKNIRWDNNGTVTGLNVGTAIGTLVGYDLNGSLPSDSFQGTSPVQVTDTYTVTLSPSYDNTFKPKMTNL